MRLADNKHEPGRAARLLSRRALAAVLVLGVGALFASCGGSGDGARTITGPPGTGTSTPPAKDTTTLPGAGGATPPATGTTPPSDTASTPPATPPATGTPAPADTASPPPGTNPSAVTSISVSPTALGLTLGDSGRVIATLATTGSAPAGGWITTWSSTAPDIATVSSSGMVKAVEVGVAGITATAGGKSAVSVVTVAPEPWVSSVIVTGGRPMMVGEQLTLTAGVASVGSTPVGGWPVTWHSDEPHVASVSASGVVTALAPGGANIRASAGTGIGRAGIAVYSDPTVTGVTLTPATLYLGPGATGSFVPALTTVGAEPSGGWPLTWTSASPAIATVSAAGVITGVAPGSTVISAASGSHVGRATVAVSTASGGTASKVTSVSISAMFKGYVLVARQKLFTASVQADGPPPQGGWTVAWSSSDPAVAAIGMDGTVTGVAPGLATISASVGGVEGTSVLEVVAPPGVVGVDIANPHDQLRVGDTVTYVGSVIAIGSAPPGGYVMTWSSDTPAVASITPGGLLTAKSLGAATITVTAYGKTASLLVGVGPTPPPDPTPTPTPPITGITSVSIQPGVVVHGLGSRGDLRADVSATTQPPYPLWEWPVAWTSSNPAVVSMSAVQTQVPNYTALSEGTATITATLGGKSATATVYVATPRDVTVSPATLSLAAGQQGTLTAAVSSTGPLPLGGYPVQYVVTSPLVASVSPSGVVTALGAGTTRVHVNAWAKSATAMVTVTGPGLTLTLSGTSTVKGTLKPYDATSYYLSCSIPLTMTATGAGTARWGREEWSTNGGPFVSVPSSNTFSPLTAGASMIWKAYFNGTPAPTAAQVEGFTATAKFHYAVNASMSDYPWGSFVQDYVVTQTYGCQP